MSLVLTLFLVACLLYFIKSKYKLFRVGSRIPGPAVLPFVGNVQMIRKLKPEYLFLVFTENRAKFRQTYRLWLGPQLWVFLHSTRETRDALNDSSLTKAKTFNQLDVLIGNGLLISHGKQWEVHRRVLGPAFHPNILNSFSEAISQHADKLVQKLANSKTQAIEVSEYLFPCMLDVIIDTSMGKKLNSQNDPNCCYTKAFHETSELLFKRMTNPLLAPDFIFKRTNLWRRLNTSLSVIHNLMETVIRERAALLRLQEASFSGVVGSSKQRRTLLDTLLTAEINGIPLTFREIRDEVNTFVFAGVDTTTAAMAFILYALAKYPAEQLKLFEEIQSHSNHSDVYDTNDQASIAQINTLEYLDMFIKESLRYYTIVPMTGRETTTETKIGNNHYCAGITLWINMYGLAHDEEYFEEPYEFRPNRFCKEQQQKIPPFCYIPFSGGAHVCIGRKYSLLIMKILTVKIVQNFEIKLKNPEEELVLMAQMVLKSLRGINLIFEPRNSC